MTHTVHLGCPYSESQSPKMATVAAGGDAEWLRERKLRIYGYRAANRNLSDSSFFTASFFHFLIFRRGFEMHAQPNHPSPHAGGGLEMQAA